LTTSVIVRLAVSAVFCAAFLVLWLVLKNKEKLYEPLEDEQAELKAKKKRKKRVKLLFWAMVISAWYLVATLFSVFKGGLNGINVEFEMFSKRTDIFGFSISNSTITAWIVIAIITVLLLLFRFLVFPKFTDKPKGLQNVVELAVEATDNFTKGVVGERLGNELGAYMFSIALLMIGCAAVELFGVRPPTSDLTMTFALGLATFILINVCGIKVKGVGGRLKSMASPSPVMFPMKIVSDVAVPVSLACRLFGNMLGGMIVMDLLKSSLGAYSLGLTSLAGVYFNLFHPLIQTYIFIILSLTFINEAAE